MKCLEFRRAAGADPKSVTPELKTHAEECAACGRYWQELRSMDEVIQRALQIEFTDQPRVAPSVRWRRSQWSMPLSLVASVAMAVVLGLILWLSIPSESFARQLVNHIENEPQSLARTPHSVDSHELNAVLGRSGITLKPGIGSISYAISCPFRGHQVPHLVVQTEEGPVTMLVLTEETGIKDRQTFEETGFNGVLLPAPRGALAVLAHGASVDGVAERFREAVQYTGPRKTG